MSFTITDFLEFLLFTVLVKAIIVHWLADQIIKILKLLFIRTNRDIAIWLHYYNRALNKGHKHINSHTCSQDNCTLI